MPALETAQVMAHAEKLAASMTPEQHRGKPVRAR